MDLSLVVQLHSQVIDLERAQSVLEIKMLLVALFQSKYLLQAWKGSHADDIGSETVEVDNELQVLHGLLQKTLRGQSFEQKFMFHYLILSQVLLHYIFPGDPILSQVTDELERVSRV